MLQVLLPSSTPASALRLRSFCTLVGEDSEAPALSWAASTAESMASRGGFQPPASDQFMILFFYSLFP